MTVVPQNRRLSIRIDARRFLPFYNPSIVLFIVWVYFVFAFFLRK